MEGRESNLLDGGAPFYRTYAHPGWGLRGRRRPRTAVLRRLIGGPGASLLPNFGDQYDRQGWKTMAARFETEFASRTRAEWVERFSGTDACVSPVLSFAECSDRQPPGSARHVRRHRRHPSAGSCPTILPNAASIPPGSTSSDPVSSATELTLGFSRPRIQPGRDRYAPSGESRPLRPLEEQWPRIQRARQT